MNKWYEQEGTHVVESSIGNKYIVAVSGPGKYLIVSTQCLPWVHTPEDFPRIKVLTHLFTIKKFEVKEKEVVMKGSKE